MANEFPRNYMMWSRRYWNNDPFQTAMLHCAWLHYLYLYIISSFYFQLTESTEVYGSVTQL